LARGDILKWRGQGEAAAIPKIIAVGALDGDCFSVTLESGHTILLELADRIHEPAFAALIENHTFEKPQTDGERLYWPDGTALSLAEIMEMLTKTG
jgi:hypothetical protein